MVFAYYQRLTAAQRRTYRASDRIVAVELTETAALLPRVAELAAALAEGKRPRIQSAAQGLINGLAEQLAVPAVRVQVLATRPSDESGELHGIYYPLGEQPARIRVWMRTARQQRVVAFRTFLRTLLHEFCHHLDYELYGLHETFHTEGFYKRESSLMHQLAARRPAARGRAKV